MGPHPRYLSQGAIIFLTVYSLNTDYMYIGKLVLTQPSLDDFSLEFTIKKLYADLRNVHLRLDSTGGASYGDVLRLTYGD
jgi:hypothetical protein